ncbi:MAG: hypothetical protein CTY12_04085 [Methylotenera sp.]|jgi:hypothetical protein|nr:MAG: hypothetical protein CTY12_04085 [Methylotenera sp.]
MQICLIWFLLILCSVEVNANYTLVHSLVWKFIDERLVVERLGSVNATTTYNGHSYKAGLTIASRVPIKRPQLDHNKNIKLIHQALISQKIAPHPIYCTKECFKASLGSNALDSALIYRLERFKIPLSLFNFQASNVTLYSKFQKYIGDYEPRILESWGQNDPFFFVPAQRLHGRTRRMRSERKSAYTFSCVIHSGVGVAPLHGQFSHQLS